MMRLSPGPSFRGHTLEDSISDIGTALHGAAGAVDCHIPIHIGVVGQTDSLAI